jgi:beta-glucosidase
MKKNYLILVFALMQITGSAQSYPFQDIHRSEDERIKNLISLLTLDEKINSLSTRLSIPRLGVKGTHTVEGLHGLAYSGPLTGQ